MKSKDTYNNSESLYSEGIRDFTELMDIDFPKDSDEYQDQDEDRIRVSFVRKRFLSYCRCGGLVDLHARISPYSRSNEKERKWISLYGLPEGFNHGELLEQAKKEKNEFVEKIIRVGMGEENTCWAILLNISKLVKHEKNTCFGYLAALFDSETNAIKSVEKMKELCGEIDLGLRIQRQASDRKAIVSLSHALSETWNLNFLAKIANIVNFYMRSDGLSIHMLRHMSEGLYIEELFGSDIMEGEPEKYPAGEDIGLADWVLINNDWLLLEQIENPKQSENLTIKAFSGKSGQVEIGIKPFENSRSCVCSGDGKKTMFVVPLRINKIAVGALAVWRFSNHPYNSDTDLSSLEYFATRVASICRWPILWQAVHRKAKELSKVSEIMTETDCPQHAAFHAVAAGVGRLANVARTIMLLKAPGSEYYFSGEDWSIGDIPTAKTFNRWKFIVPIDSEEKLKKKVGYVLPDINDILEIDGKRLRLVHVFAFQHGRLEGAVVLLDYECHEDEKILHAIFDDELSVEMARSFLSETAPILANHVHILAQRVIREYSDPSLEDSKRGAGKPEDILRRAARCLKTHTRCDAVIVYSETSKRFKVSAASPKIEGITGHGQLTDTVIRTNQAIQILDVEDKNDKLNPKLNHKILKRIADDYGWEGIRSWICVPVVSGGRCVGVFKLLTSRKGIYLGTCHMEVAQAVANHAGSEILQITKRYILEKLNNLSYSLSGKKGKELSSSMAEDLKGLFDRFIQPKCKVAVVANIHSTYPKIFSISKNVGDSLKKGIEKASQKIKEKQYTGNIDKFHAISVSVGVPGNKTLSGRLFALADTPFREFDISVIAETAREISILLDYESNRYAVPRMVGRFRHAVIGPVQGLTSAARMLHTLAKSGTANEKELKKLKTSIEQEAEAIRLWRENQRIYMTGDVDLRLKNQDLKPVIDKSFDRFRELFDARGIKMNLYWKYEGLLPFRFDRDAIDLVMCNILDNALKYSFYNRELKVGIEIVNNNLKIWVEDEGHPIPEYLSETIYDVGERIDWVDPLRTIYGSGLGLPMVKALVEAHKGRISHTSKPLGQPKENNVQPHRVRFSIELPYTWVKR